MTGKLQAGVAVSTGGGKNAKGKVTPEVSADAYGGKAITYGISTDPKTADAITSRKRKPPNPVDPRSIPEGTAITLDKSTYTGLNLSASYRGVQASLDYQKGKAGFPATSSSTIRLQNANQLERNAFAQLGVIPEGTKGGSDIPISLTDPQLQALHEKAIEYLAAYASKTEGKPVSTDKIRELLAKGLDVDTGLGNVRTALLLLAKSNDPTAILNALATANQTGGLGPFLVRLDDQLSRNGRPGIANLDVKATPSSC